MSLAACNTVNFSFLGALKWKLGRKKTSKLRSLWPKWYLVNDKLWSGVGREGRGRDNVAQVSWNNFHIQPVFLSWKSSKRVPIRFSSWVEFLNGEERWFPRAISRLSLVLLSLVRIPGGLPSISGNWTPAGSLAGNWSPMLPTEAPCISGWAPLGRHTACQPWESMSLPALVAGNSGASEGTGFFLPAWWWACWQRGKQSEEVEDREP